MKTKLSRNIHFIFAIITIAILFISGCNKLSGQSDGRVLIIITTEDKNESFGMEKFETALKNGGQITISIDEIRTKYKDFEDKYAIPGPDGKFAVNGALINFVVDHGWSFHSFELGGVLIFVRK